MSEDLKGIRQKLREWQPELPFLKVREIRAEDEAVLIDIYRSTREQELLQTPWSEDQKTWFIKQQFDAQHFHYQTYYADSCFWLLLKENDIIGRLYVDVSDQLRIIDITLLPDFRSQGIGASLLQDLQDFAVSFYLPVSIHVEQYNPAKKLYERLGFREVEVVNSIYFLMEWRPGDGIKKK